MIRYEIIPMHHISVGLATFLYHILHMISVYTYQAIVVISMI